MKEHKDHEDAALKISTTHVEYDYGVKIELQEGDHSFLGGQEGTG